MLKKKRVIVLDKVRYGDADIIITTLDKHGGKLCFFAPSALKSRKRFAGGVLDPANFIEVLYSKKMDGNLNRLKEAFLLNSFDKIRASFDKMNFALKMLKLTKVYAQEGVVDSSSLFDLLGNSLATLEKCDNLELFKVMFEVKFWSIQGLLPSVREFHNILEVPMVNYKSLSLDNNKLAKTNMLLESVREKNIL